MHLFQGWNSSSTSTWTKSWSTANSS
jgi:hypothetical protein